MAGMKRGLGLILTAALLLTLLAACVQKTAAGNAAGDVADTERQTESAAPEETAPEVENNGGYYVRVGGDVYFRRYGADALPKAATFGEFTAVWGEKAGESELMRLSTVTGALTALYTETGTGPLWYGDGGFYLRERVNNADRVVWYALDGSGSEELCPGVPLGVTKSGLLAVQHIGYSQGYEASYTFYRDGSAVGGLTTEDYMDFAGLTDEGLFLLCPGREDEESGADRLRQITPEGKLIELGALPETEEDAAYYDPQADRFLDAGGKVVFGVGYYAGTGHFLNESVFVEATAGRENSVRALTADVGEGVDFDLPRLMADGGGNVSFVSALPGELRIGYDEAEGALEVWSGDGWRILSEHFLPSDAEGYGYRRIVQHMDYLDGTAYVTLACAHASPADAIGWRDAYALLDMLYLAVDGDGSGRELAAVDHRAELYGNVWFIEGESMALWQQLATSYDGSLYESEYVYAIPIAEDAYWEGGWEAVFDGSTGLLPYDYGEDEANRYGYPLPDAEPAGALCLELDKDGAAVSLARKAPEAVLAIEFDVPESELGGAVKTLAPERRASDEDTPWFWAKLRALEDGVRVRVDRTPDDTEALADVAMTEGLFVAGETLYDGTLNRGEYLAVRVSLPWHPELRASVSKDGAWGAYVFGEDNYLHLETEESVHPEVTLAACPLPGLMDYTGKGTREALTGTWLYRRPDTGELVALVHFDEDGGMAVEAEESGCEFSYEMDWLYAGDWDGPDLLCLRTDDPDVARRLGFNGAVGDYLAELFRTDGEEILHLTQMNNGDGALSLFLPGAGGREAYDYVLTRDRGTGEGGARRRGVTFPAMAARFDGDAGLLWLQEAAVVDEYEDGSAMLRATSGAPCVAYPVADGVTVTPAYGANAGYPMAVFDATVDGDGNITALAEPAGA